MCINEDAMGLTMEKMKIKDDSCANNYGGYGPGSLIVSLKRCNQSYSQVCLGFLIPRSIEGLEYFSLVRIRDPDNRV